MYNTTWGKEDGRGREETRLGRAVNWNGSAEGGVRAVESEMAHCESYLSCCLRIYGVRYTRIYIYIYLRGFAPIGRLSMVIGPWYSRAPYVKEYEASGGRKRGNLSVHPLRGVFPPGSKDSRCWKHTFHWREDAAATCRLSMLLRAFLSLFSLEGRIGRGGSRLNRGQR